MPTVKEQHAAFAAVTHKLPDIVNHLVPDKYIPFVGNLRQVALQKIEAPQAQPIILELVDAALDAAEKART